jgi:two-component system sensor histidine kinase PhoQ
MDADIAFRGDEGDLLELLGNLLDNAFKWAASTVRITAHTGGSTIELSVEDDGPGIDAERADEVLQRGVRLDEATPGHGIGLPMVRDIVEAYGGELKIERSQHGGAAITATLPGQNDQILTR